jgi:endo-1,4-beta-xylanase
MKSSKLNMFAVFVLLFSLIISVQAQTTLKDAFKNDFLIGASLNRPQFYGKDKRILPIVKKQFNTISPENALKWESVHPTLGKYDFKDADKYVEFGEKNGMFIIGHALVWHNQIPKEVFEDEKGNPVSREVLLGRMREHIQKVVGRYKGRIKGWDVVNEAVADDGTMRQTPWLKIIGEDYIEKAFEYAHEADPKAELYYNDYSVELEAKRKGILKVIKNLVDKKVPITAVGLQGHNNLTFPTVKQQDDTIKQFAALGIKVMITELDVSVLPDPEGFSGAEVTLNFEMQEKLDPYKNGLPAEIQKAQENRYSELFKVFLNNRKHISRITFWNVTDGDSWLNNFPVRGRTNYPLLFDREGKSKPVLETLIKDRLKYFSKN